MRPLSDIAAELHCSERTVKDMIRAHAIPVIRAGRNILFDPIAYSALVEALRCRSQSSASAASRASGSRAPSRGSAFAAALRATTRSSRARKPPSSKPTSSEAPGTGSVLAFTR